MLKGKQKECLALMLAGEFTQKEIAKKIGVTEQTIVNWKKKKEFEEEFNKALHKKINLTAAKAFKTEVALLDMADSDSVRLNAAKDILDRAGFKPKDEIELTKPVDDTIKEMSEYFERRAREDT